MSAFSDAVSWGLIGPVWSGRSWDWPLTWRTSVTCCEASVSLATTRLIGPAPKWTGDTETLSGRIAAVMTSGAAGRGSFLNDELLPQPARAATARTAEIRSKLLIPARTLTVAGSGRDPEPSLLRRRRL